MIKVYEAVFNRKIDYFRTHPNYGKLRKSADQALKAHTGYGADAIAAGDFMDRIVKMPLDYIAAWMDGKNGLEWIDKENGRDYDKISLADALNAQREGGEE